MTYRINYENSKSGELTMNINGFYIHSRYNPLREAKQIASSKYVPHALHIIFGYGCGYVVEALSKECKFNEPILVIDPLLENEEIGLYNHTYERIYFGKTEKEFELLKILSQLMSYDANVVIIANSNYEKLFSYIYADVLKTVRDIQYTETINVNTIVRFSKEWQINYFMNLKNALQDTSLQKIHKIYDCPIVVAAGGPSLTKQIPLLKEYRSQFILICAGSTINTLLKHDINPDYVVSIDGGEANFEVHFKGLDLKYPHFVYSILNHYKVNTVFSNTAFPFIPETHELKRQKIISRFGTDITILKGGGSVAHYSLELAKYITKGEICLIGQDLAYTNNQTHAVGNRRNTVIKDNPNLIKVEGYYDSDVQTDAAFQSMIFTFNNLQEVSPHEKEVYNCTEGGAKLKLYNQMEFKEFLAKNCLFNVERIEISEAEVYFDEEKYIKEELEHYEELKKILKKGQKILLPERGPLFKEATIKKLDETDKKLHKIYAELELNTLLEPTLLAAEKKYLPKINETSSESFNRVKSYTDALYGECYKVLEDYKIAIEDILRCEGKI